MTYRSKVAWIFLLGFALDLVNMFVATVAYPDIARELHASVSASRRVLRMSNVTPSSASRRLMLKLTTARVWPSKSAAAVNEPASTTALKVSNRSRLTMFKPADCQNIFDNLAGRRPFL